MEFVSCELSKKLKEKGYPQRPDYFNYSSYYEWDGLRKIHSLCNASVWFDPNISRDNIYFAPTISQVLTWFRKDFGINLYAIKNSSGKYLWQHDACYVNEEYEREAWGGYSCPTWEETILEGIEYVLDNLIKL